MTHYFSSFKTHLQKKYPSLPESLLSSLSPQLASEHTIQITSHQWIQAQKIVSDLWTLQKHQPFLESIEQRFPFRDLGFQKTPSIINSLDVHIDSRGDLKIIEINTNASSFLVNAEHAEFRGLQTFPHAKDFLKKSFATAFSSALQPGHLFLIVDEKPREQKMYIEFLMFQSFLQKEFGVACEMADPQELSLEADGQLIWNNQKVFGIYNRHTDFYFSKTPCLFKAFQKDKTRISPNPWGYSLSADKNRLVEWNEAFFEKLRSVHHIDLPHLQNALLKTFHFSNFKDAEDLWSQRAQFFFKPPNAFGSRSVYKGKSISRTVFQRIYDDGYLAQEAVPPPEVSRLYEHQTQTYKYDLRFYFFEGVIHLGVARLYQGQLTNLQTPGGGLTPLEIVSP